ncbi:MAG TPA: hypothetical protein VFQ90_19950 [Stellaceae bacterium]|jgi:hypothetical protein|nr:hypothetical protein [Stellaceae bacterium]
MSELFEVPLTVGVMRRLESYPQANPVIAWMRRTRSNPVEFRAATWRIMREQLLFAPDPSDPGLVIAAGSIRHFGGSPIDAAQGHRSPMETDGPPTLASMGVSKQQASDWQTVARMPEEDFEREVKQGTGTRNAATPTSARRQVRYIRATPRCLALVRSCPI